MIGPPRDGCGIDRGWTESVSTTRQLRAIDCGGSEILGQSGGFLHFCLDEGFSVRSRVGVAVVGFAAVAALASGCSGSSDAEETSSIKTGRTNDCTHYVGDNLSWEQFVGEYQVQDLEWVSAVSAESIGQMTAAEYNKGAVESLKRGLEVSGASVRSMFDAAPVGSMSALTVYKCVGLSRVDAERFGSSSMQDSLKRTREQSSESPAVNLRNGLYTCAFVAEGQAKGKSLAETFNQSDPKSNGLQDIEDVLGVLCPNLA